MTLHHIVSCFAFILCIFTCSEESTVPYAQVNQLLNDFLFNNDSYNPSLRPVYNLSATVDVEVGFSYLGLRTLAQKEQDVSVSGNFYLVWQDEFVAAFFKKLFAQGINVYVLVVPASKLWTPDVSILTGDEHALLDLSAGPARIYPSGHVSVVGGGVMTFGCKLNLMYFPFDQQRCMSGVNLWISQASEIRLIPGDVKMNAVDELTHSDWVLLNISSKVVAYIGDHYETQTVEYWLSIRRRSLGPVMTILLPTILQAILVVVVFSIPPESGERMSFAITVFLAFSMWSVTINDDMPRNDDSMPLLAGCLSMLMCSSAIAVVISTIVVQLDRHRDNMQTVPKWMQMLRGVFNHWPCRRYTRKVTPDELSEASLSWRTVAATVDRVSFWTFLIIFLSGSIAVAVKYATGSEAL